MAQTTFALHGYERFFAMHPQSSAKLAHVLTLQGDIAPLLTHLPEAVRLTFNQHPKMRVTLLPGESPQKALVCPPLVDVAEVKSLLTVVHRGQEEQSQEWKAFVQRECELPFDREREFPFRLHVFVDQATSKFARFVLFSDHYMSDANSGPIVLHSVLDNATRLATSADLPEELPVRPSLYECEHSVNPWVGVVKEAVAKWVVEPYFQYGHADFRPMLPIDSETQKDFRCGPPEPRNPSFALFAHGNETNMLRALARCKEEEVSLQGALVAATALAYALTRHSSLCYVTKVQLKMDVTCDMRPHLDEPFEERVVGLYETAGSLVYTSSEGVEMLDQSFWEAARRADHEFKCAIHSPEMKVQTLYVHESLNAENIESTLEVAQSVMGDTTLANIGAYPYSLEHDLAADKRVEVTGLHVYNSLPSLSSATMLFLSAVKAFDYSMMYKIKDTHAQRLFHWYVQCVEHLGSITKEETMLQVGERLKESCQPQAVAPMPQ